MAIQWNDIRANFNDANSAMGNVQRGLSQAGTVFGELRKAILDEEQRALENDYRQKTFDENVRQFGLQYGLDQDRLAEQIRAAQADEAHQAAVLEETIRANQEKERIDRINAANQYAYQQGLLRDKNETRKQENRDREALAAIMKNITYNRNTLDKSISDLENKITNTVDPNKKIQLQSELDILKNERKGMTDTYYDSYYRQKAAELGIPISNTPFTPGATLEQERTEAAITRSDEQQKNRSKGEIEAAKLIQGMNLTSGQQALAQQVLAKASTIYPNVPIEALANVLSSLSTYNAYFDFDGKNAFSGDFLSSDLENFVRGINLENNPINILFANKALTYERNK